MTDPQLAAWLKDRPTLKGMATYVAAGQRDSTEPVPRVQVQTVTGFRTIDFDGDGQCRTPLVQIDVFAANQSLAETLTDLVENAIADDLAGETFGGKVIISADVENRFAGPVERPPAGQQQSLGRVVIELRLAIG